jgi:hypothetical protein
MKKIHKGGVVLHIISYGCEIWSLTLREEYRLNVFENSADEDILDVRGWK